MINKNIEGQIAVRAYAIPDGFVQKVHQGRWRTHWPELTLVIDCATSNDMSKRLLYGSYLVLNSKEVVDRGLFYANDLQPAVMDELKQFASEQTVFTEKSGEQLRLLSRDSFIREVFHEVAYRAKGVVVGFNLPFQISRLAVDWSEARAKPYVGGFSFPMLNYEDEEGHVKHDSFTPRIAVKAIDGKRALIGFTSAWQQDPKIKDGSNERNKKTFRGHFVDVRTFAFALSGEYFDLENASACFGVTTPSKVTHSSSSDIANQAANLIRRVELISQLYHKLLSEYSDHKLSLPPDMVYSPASIGKAYLKEMGIQPPSIQVSGNINMTPDDVRGAAMISYHGGRTECRIRRVPVPVSYVDFLSMYPTVNALMGLKNILVADTIKVVDWTQETNKFLDNATAELFFDPLSWESLSVLVKVLPENDVLPSRTKYGRSEKSSFTLGVNRITSPIPIWYTLADCIASKLLTGRSPEVVEAIRFIPEGTQKNLRTINVLGIRDINPQFDDFFQTLVELRYSLKHDTSIDPGKRQRLPKGLKRIVSASSYGIFIELNRQEGEESEVEVHGLENFICEVNSPEEPGSFFFPIIGSLLTGGARLMLALLENEITRRGGSYAFMDTDSAAIVATRKGGLVYCPGGEERLPDGRPAIKALNWKEIYDICMKFDRLNPYNRDFVSTGILKLEEENFINNDDGLERIELQCYSISSKRYVLFYEKDDYIHIQKASEHGLGNYLPPIEDDQEVRGWIEQAWRMIIRTDTSSVVTDDPAWLDEFVCSRISLSSPKMMDWMKGLNSRRTKKMPKQLNGYQESIKPFNTIDHVLLSQMPTNLDEEGKPACLIFPSSEDHPARRAWVNIHDPEGKPYRIVSPKRQYWGGQSCPGQTYRELINRHVQHPESKSLTYGGTPCMGSYRGLLLRRHIQVKDVLHIGKEANEIEKVQAGLIDSEGDVLLTYERDLWEFIQPILSELPIPLIQERTGYKLSMVYKLRRGERRPGKDRLPVLLTLVAEYARKRLTELTFTGLPSDDRTPIAIYSRLLLNEAKLLPNPIPNQSQ